MLIDAPREFLYFLTVVAIAETRFVMKLSRSIRRFVPALLILMAGLACSNLAQGQLPPVRIIPVGDSITDGSSVTNSLGAGGPGGGYRLPLWQSLTNAGYNVDYLGLQTVNPSAVGMPTHHEGHSGWKIDQIYSNMINAVFGAVEDPDVLLIMIGTNDFGGGYDVNNATNRLSQLIGLLTTKWPYCKVIVAGLTARSGALGVAIQTNYNNSLPGIVSNFQAVGRQVYFTDMNPVVPVNAEFMPDGLHPNTGGYIKMATNWFPAITNVIGPTGTTNAPVIARLSPVTGLSNIVITFSKPVDDATATNVANYFVDGGLTVLNATLEPTNKRIVTLTTTPMMLHSSYLLIVQNVADRTPAATVMDPGVTNFQTYGASGRGVFNNVPEAGDYRLVYSLNIPTSPNYSTGITYDKDFRAFASNFTRVAYYLELQPAGGPLDFVWASFDAMTTNVNKIGVPTFASGANFQMNITNLTVLSSMPSVLNGTNMSGGNIEFWPSNYSQANAVGVPNASGSTFDWGDTQATSGNYGCMQVHNHDASQVIFAFNHWNSSVVADLGIGNGTGTNNPDWTFGGNANQYTVKVLQVYALLTSNAPPAIANSQATGYSNLVINFSAPVADDATNVAFYTFSGGLTAISASLDSLTRQTVSLIVSPMSPGMTYTAVVNNVHDRSSSNSMVIATNSTALFQGPPTNGVFNNVLDAANYSLVYSLNITTGAAYNATGVPYDTDLRSYVGAYSRIAYYLELQTATGMPDYIWVALDPFSTNASLIGVPAMASSPTFQQPITNMTVKSSVASIVQGDGIATGNIEFWPWDYSAPNAKSVPNASTTAYDWGDTAATNGGHGSMQLHNYGANLGATTGQVLFAFNNWGNAANGVTALGIGNRPGSADADWTFAANTPSYTVKRLQVFALPVSNVAPVIATVIPQSFSNVVLQFSKCLDDSSIALTNFSIGGLTVLSATLDQTTKTRVTLITSPQTPSTLYTSVVSNVRDRTTNLTEIAPNSAATFRALAVNGVYANVPEAANYNLVYSLNVPNAANYSLNSVAYDVDAHTNVGVYSRIAYYMELQAGTGPVNFVWASLDPFTTDPGKIGVPTSNSGAFFQQYVTNLTVISSVSNIVQAAGITTGNIEFWPWSYTITNSLGVPNASSNVFDWGDCPTGGGNYGSMQLHNYGASQTLFAFNNWGGAGNNCDIGIGNNTNTANSDWTQTYYAPNYTTKVLQVFVLPLSNSPPLLAGAFGQLGFSNVVITFNKALDDSAAAVTNFSLSGGVTVLAAVLDPVTKARVTLTTTPQLPFTVYTVTVNNVIDRTLGQSQIAPNSTMQFRTLAGVGAWANVPEAANYQLVQSINLPIAASYPYNVNYDVDMRSLVTNFTRVAYYLELQTNNGPVNFAWTSFDAPTNNINAIGIPTTSSGGNFQQSITNLNVLSSVANIVNGTGLSGGNIEFWPSNYSNSNAVNVANALNNAYDWGDIRTGGNYGSMQVHNHDANLGASTGQVIWAFNRWGGTATTTDDIGIGNRPASADVDWTFAQNANTFTGRILQIYALNTTNLPPVVLDASGQVGLSNVVIQFSKPLADTSATVTNFSISGLTILAASLDVVTKTRVTLTTAPQAAGTFYTLTIAGGIQDRTAGALPLSGGPTYTFMSAPRKGIYNNVAEAAGYTLVYSLNIQSTGNWSVAMPPYSVDNRIGVTNYSRIGYYLELQKTNGAPSFVWTTMDPFTQDVGMIGVPVVPSGAYFQQPVTNLSVFSSAFGVLNGTNMSGGNIEFWPNAYTTTNSAAVPNANSTTLDWGDQPTGGNYGSMQVHNGGAGQVVFAFNNWGTTNTLELGIGNNYINQNPDWTFAYNAGTYTSRLLQVYVLQSSDTTPPTILSAVASLDRNQVLVTFSEPIADASVVTGNFAINNGIIVSAAAFSNNLRQVTLTVSQLAVGTYTLTVNNVRDRSPNANPIAPNSTAIITAPLPPSQIIANAPEAADYQLLYYLNIPATSPGWNTTGTTYNIDNRNAVAPFSRVAYYMELATNATGPTNWVYVSVDAFTTDVNKLGVPDLPSGALFQQKLTNMNVFSSQGNITTGTGFSGGNIEFWPQNYAQANVAAVTNASASTFDWGDQISTIFGTGGHGSMQIHNAGASNVLFAYNAWGSVRTSEMGIGNQPTNGVNGNPDWTSTANANSYTLRRLYVLVRPTSSTNGPVPVRALGYQGRTNVLVTFNSVMSDASANPTNFIIDGGALAVTAATLQPNFHDILLTTSPQTPGSNYTIAVSNVTDRTTNGNAIAAGASVNFTALPALGVFANVPEASGYTLVYGLGLPGPVPNYSTNSVSYGIDQRSLITQSFSRVAYYMEVATNAGPTNWVYISDDWFTTNIRLIGVPVWNLGINYQQKLATNANIWSSDTNIITGTGIGTCSIEFWPWNYSTTSNAVVPNGSTSLYDWNDTYSTAGQYGSMQIHNYGALVGGGISTGQVLFAFNKWGSGQSGNTDIGIGSQPVNHPDWTSAGNGATYTTKNLYILVKLTNSPVTPPSTNVTPLLFVLNPGSLTATAGTTNTLAALAIGTAPAYQWRFNGSPIVGQTNSWIVFAPSATNNSGNYDVIASNSASVVTSLVAILSITNPPPPSASGYDAWAAQIANGLTNYNDSALGDGYPNLLKYATGSNPTNADGLARMNASRIGAILALLFNRDTNAIDVTFIVEGASTVDDFALWNGIATNIAGSWGGATNVVENISTNPASVTVLDTAPGETNRFLRLRITRP